ncbi:MAG: patatin-like phospholipase family protein [Vicinamibacterales bacterium]
MPDGRQQFDQVFRTELTEIERRRDQHTTSADDSRDAKPKDAKDAPKTERTLVGLAFSGGGIRSATFGLGVLESLKALQLLKHVDYLSTVSGGGYIGAWLSANCKRAADQKPLKSAAPDWLDAGSDWTASIAHLRRYSNYLSPKVGFLSADTWSMGAIWIRNTLLVQLTVVMAIAAVLLLPRLLFDGFLLWPATGHWRWFSVLLFVVAITGIAGNQRRLNKGPWDWLLHAGRWKTSTALTGVALTAAILIGRHWQFQPFGSDPVNYWVAFPIAVLLLAAGFFAQPLVLEAVGRALPARHIEEINYTQGWVQFAVVIPLMGVGYFLAAVLWGQAVDAKHTFSGMKTFGELFQHAWLYWPLPLSLAFASLWVLSLASLRKYDGWSVVVALVAPLPVMVVQHALLCGLMLLLHVWAAHPVSGAWHAFVWTPALVLYSFALTVNLLIGMIGRNSSESVREWWSRLGAWLGIYGLAWMVMTITAVYGPRWAFALMSGPFWTRAWTIGAWLATTAAALLAGNSGATGADAKRVRPRTTTERILGVVTKVGPLVFIAGLLVGVSTALYLIVLNLSLDTFPPLASFRTAEYWTFLNLSTFWIVVSVLVVATFCLLLLAGRVDINEFSLNAFYRSRLSRCYLGATRCWPQVRHPQNFTGLDDEDDMQMAKLRGDPERPAAGPLHVVNCALNLGGSTDLGLNTRHSASFIVTPYVSGSSYPPGDGATADPIGYWPTNTYGGADGQPTLAQAISVSGAAASPNMGYHTSAVVAFLLTIFNVRLGWWFPNPRMAAAGSPSPWFGLRYLLKELFGGATDASKFLMISDGGHFENLGAYELVRRKCRVIVISDAECDADLHFEGLGALMRMCEVDFGTRITIDVGKIRRQDDWSARSCAVGRIHYGGDTPDGTLIYLKAVTTGKEDTDVLQYASCHPMFPHETTGDQFYGEDQFESYRRLGRYVGRQAFGAAAPVGGTRTIVTMAEELLAAAEAGGPG